VLCSPMRRPSWSSPRAWTSKLSPPPGSGATRRLTLVAASASRRSPILLPVIWVPSRPASGLSFGLNTMLGNRTKRGSVEGCPNTDQMHPVLAARVENLV